MGRRRKLPQNTSSRDVHIRIKGQENCILLDHFITDFKIKHVGKKDKYFLNDLFGELLMNFVSNKVALDKESTVYALIKPHIQKAIKESTRLSDLMIVTNFKKIHEELNAIARMLSYILRAFTKIGTKDENGNSISVLSRSGVEQGDIVGTTLLPWIKDIFKDGEF